MSTHQDVIREDIADSEKTIESLMKQVSEHKARIREWNRELAQDSKPTMRNIVAGDAMTMTCVGDRDEVTFLGFTAWDKAYSTTPIFQTWKHVAQALGVPTFAKLDEAESKRAYGYTVYAIFRSADGEFGAYRSAGKWCIASGAHPIRLSNTAI